MAKIFVDKNFDYRWPSGSVTAFKADPEPVTTRRICVDYAIDNGFGRDADESKPKGGAVKPGTYMVGKGDEPEAFTPSDGSKIVVQDATK